jgi:hypothetical protein
MHVRDGQSRHCATIIGKPRLQARPMHLQGSCHCGRITFSVDADAPVPFMRCYCSICRKTAGTGGYAINLGAKTITMRVTGKRHLRIYRAQLPDKTGTGTHASSGRRYFCGGCGSALWLWDPTWPELVHPHAGAIDTPLPTPPEHVHCLLDSKAAWVQVEGHATDQRFEHYPDQSLAAWHAAHGFKP